MKALLLAGGRGTRMKPLTHTSNKHAIPLANKPLILYPFEMIVNSGIKEIAVVVNETKPEIEAILGDGSKWGVKVTYLFQDKPGGLAHALSLAEDYMGDAKFVMVLGDNILEKGITENVKRFSKSKSNGHVLGVKTPIEDHRRLGVATVDKNNEVIVYIEKPGVVEHDERYNPDSSYAVPGFYFFDKNVFGCFKGKNKIKPSVRGELEIPAPYNWLINNGFKVSLDVVSGWYKDPGNPNDTLTTNQVMLETMTEDLNEGEVDEKSKLSGKVRIEKGTKVINSIIRGPVAIGKDCLIENAYVGPYTSIYHKSKIIDCEIENSIVLGEANIHNLSTRLDSSLIGWFSEVKENKGLPKSSRLFIGDNSVVEF